MVAVLAVQIPAYGHSEHDKPRFVAPGGVDQGACDDRFRPCRTVAYAASRANKGDRLLLARGRYAMETAEDLFYLGSGVVRVMGGFSRQDYYQLQDTAVNKTVLEGVPPEYGSALRRQGFVVIADRKSLPQPELDRAKEQLESYKVTQKSQPPTECVNGQAQNFSCDSVDLMAHVSLNDFSSAPSEANDIWGFVDLNTGREYAIIGLRNGTAVMDVSDTDNVFEVGTVAGTSTTWRDIKVLQRWDGTQERWFAYAYVTADSATDKLVVIDLSGLPNMISESGRVTDETSAHNVTISNVNYATGVAIDGRSPQIFTAGSDLTNGAFRRYDLGDPVQPVLAGTSTSGYMHDAASFLVDDSRAPVNCNGASTCEVLVDFNETTVELWELTGGGANLLSTASYPQVGYVHSGWWSEDLQYLFVQDELDEQNSGLNTTLRVFSLADLGALPLVGVWTGPTQAIDHNGYVRGNRYYMSNYTRGLTILDITAPQAPVAAGYFDTFPSMNSAVFNGAWGVYPFLPSGKLLVSDIDSGLYVFQDRTLDGGEGMLMFSSPVYGGVEGGTVRIDVERTGGTGPVSVSYRVQTGSADTSDFNSVSGTLNWASNDTSPKGFDLALVSDGQSESTEQLFVELYDPRDGSSLASPGLASVFVVDQNQAGEFGFWDSDLSVDEVNDKVILTVRRSGGVTGAVDISFQTNDGTATAGNDYVAQSGTLSWGDGDGSPRTITIALTDDGNDESVEDFTIDLTVSGGASLVPPPSIGTAGTATVTISDDDNTPPPPASPPPSGGGGGGTMPLSWLFIMVWALKQRRRPHP